MEVQKNLNEEQESQTNNIGRQTGSKRDWDRERVLDFNEHRKEQSLQKHGRFIYSEKVCLREI